MFLQQEKEKGILMYKLDGCSGVHTSTKANALISAR